MTVVAPVDDWGYPVSRHGTRDPRVSTDLRHHAEHAVRTCPLLALRLVDG